MAVTWWSKGQVQTDVGIQESAFITAQYEISLLFCEFIDSDRTFQLIPALLSGLSALTVDGPFCRSPFLRLVNHLKPDLL